MSEPLQGKVKLYGNHYKSIPTSVTNGGCLSAWFADVPCPLDCVSPRERVLSVLHPGVILCLMPDSLSVRGQMLSKRCGVNKCASLWVTALGSSRLSKGQMIQR